MGIRQAVVIVHGMGEQRPLDALNGFIDAALEPEDDDDGPFFYSRPTEVSGSYEAKRYLAPPRWEGGAEKHAQTEFFEYHWAHLMQGNRLSDMWPTVRKMLLRPPWSVPSGLRGVWALIWGLIVLVAWALTAGPLSDLAWSGESFADAITTWGGGSLLAVVVAVLIKRLLSKLVPSLVTPSFVDVVRYLDTSPRSYEVRHQIRKGMVDLLTRLHDGRYDRIVVVAHSLGAYIAYDGITSLWAQTNTRKMKSTTAPPDGLEDVEDLASQLARGASDASKYQEKQRGLWAGLREQGNPWLITDFVSVGTPMYFADRLYTKNRDDFDRRVRRLDLPTCPPQRDKNDDEENNLHQKEVWFSYVWGRDRSLHHAAPFAVVRWTNMWYPTRFGFFGDWFGGPLAPLFGRGIVDIEILGNKPARLGPGFAHALYFNHPDDTAADSVTTHLRTALDLASTKWVEPTTKHGTVWMKDLWERRLKGIDRRLEAIEKKLAEPRRP